MIDSVVIQFFYNFSPQPDRARSTPRRHLLWQPHYSSPPPRRTLPCCKGRCVYLDLSASSLRQSQRSDPRGDVCDQDADLWVRVRHCYLEGEKKKKRKERKGAAHPRHRTHPALLDRASPASQSEWNSHQRQSHSRGLGLRFTSPPAALSGFSQAANHSGRSLCGAVSPREASRTGLVYCVLLSVCVCVCLAACGLLWLWQDVCLLWRSKLCSSTPQSVWEGETFYLFFFKNPFFLLFCFVFFNPLSFIAFPASVSFLLNSFSFFLSYLDASSLSSLVEHSPREQIKKTELEKRSWV